MLTAPECPAFAGALALAAGRFQSLLRVGPAVAAGNPGSTANRRSPLEAVLSGQEALQLVLRIQAQVAAAVPRYDQLGDDCDFLTLATDWPYRYTVENADGPARGIYALDDLIGRRLDPQAPGRLDRARQRWAYAGRLLGDPAASVARAMAALFLQPKSALLWNTYRGGGPKSSYEMSRAAARLRRDLLGTGAVEYRTGRSADLASWHRVVNPVNRFGLVFVNSSGGPQQFAIEGGPGRPADLPRGDPVAVCMIHSHSAADLADPQTLAGRWLAQGAFVFYGSVNEPFLPAFRQPNLVAELLTEGIPLVAALRESESEAFGFPWRLMYLGDPLYRLENRRMGRQSADSQDFGGRISVAAWQTVAPEYANWRVVEVKPPILTSEEISGIPDTDTDTDTNIARLHSCLDAAIAESASGSALSGRVTASRPGTGQSGAPIPDRTLDWRRSLRSIQRQRLERRLRPIFDELLIDALGELGFDEELQSRLAQIPTEEKSPRVWLTIETCAAARLARLDVDPDRAGSFRRALELWNEVIRLSWPKGSSFPAQFTERMTVVASADATRRMQPWLIRLRATAQEMSRRRDEFPHAEAVAAERARVEKKINSGLRF